MSELLASPAAALPAVLRTTNGVSALFQPIVELDSGEPVAVEALARGPIDTELERADRLFAAARESGCLAELDWSCRAAAVEGALEADLPHTVPLFVNVEPETLGAPCPARYAATFALARERLTVVVELAERALIERPAELLGAVERMRDWGWSIALDNVGADPRSLALLPVLGPDVIKLDLRVLQSDAANEVASVVVAVGAEAERTGALILAAGIERDEDVEIARAMGATLGQGWLYGLPARRPAIAGVAGIELPPRRWRFLDGTPYDLAAEQIEPRRASRGLAQAMGRHLEAHAQTLGDAGVVLRGDELPEDWSLVVLAPHYAAALVAVDLGDDGPEDERRCDVILTYERELVTEIAATLLARQQS